MRFITRPLPHFEIRRRALCIFLYRRSATVGRCYARERIMRVSATIILAATLAGCSAEIEHGLDERQANQIAALLDEASMRRFRELAAHYKMDALVEVHDEEELGPAVASGARLIGVNNRNLHTFEVNLGTALRLAEKIPAGVVRVAESGINSSADIERLRASGYQAFLVGEHLMKSGDPAGALRALLSC